MPFDDDMRRVTPAEKGKDRKAVREAHGVRVKGNPHDRAKSRAMGGRKRKAMRSSGRR